MPIERQDIADYDDSTVCLLAGRYSWGFQGEDMNILCMAMAREEYVLEITQVTDRDYVEVLPL